MIVTLQRLGDNALCPLSLEITRIGRGAENEIVIEDDTVSTNHAIISQQQDDKEEIIYFIKDLDSTNHTYVNNVEITNHKLTDGDIIRIGNTRFKFSTRSFIPQQEISHEKTRKIKTRGISSFLFTR